MSFMGHAVGLSIEVIVLVRILSNRSFTAIKYILRF